MNSPQTFIFMGRSGSGKGTQTDLLKTYLKEKDSSREIFSLEVGAKFREIWQGSTYSSKLSNEIYKAGKRQPGFLAINVWSNIFVNDFKGTENVVIDGIARSKIEAEALTTALEFYDRKANVIFLDISRDESIKRLLLRGREDDKTKEDIEKRLDWYDADTEPAVDYFRTNDRYSFFDINGEQDIDGVHSEIVNKLDLQ